MGGSVAGKGLTGRTRILRVPLTIHGQSTQRARRPLPQCLRSSRQPGAQARLAMSWGSWESCRSWPPAGKWNSLRAARQLEAAGNERQLAGGLGRRLAGGRATCLWPGQAPGRFAGPVPWPGRTRLPRLPGQCQESAKRRGLAGQWRAGTKHQPPDTRYQPPTTRHQKNFSLTHLRVVHGFAILRTSADGPGSRKGRDRFVFLGG